MKNLLLGAMLALVVPTIGASALAQVPKPDAPASSPASAPQTTTLGVGDAAPALNIEKWVKGAPVQQFEKGKVYMVEFWATWCGPCITSMPHISELQKKYRDQGFTVIGVTSKDSRGNSLEKVEKMVTDKGDTMGYTVGWDKDRATNEAFMTAAKQNGIPCSFLVDRNGKIAYIGHPMSIDSVLEQVIAGKHDIEKLKAEAAEARLREEKAEALQERLGPAIESSDWDSVDKICDEMVALGGDMVEQGLMIKYQIMLFQAKDAARTVAAAKAVLEGPMKDNFRALAFIAQTMVSPQSKIDGLDMGVALKAAEQAVKLTNEKDGKVLEVLASVHFAKGDVAKAIEVQKKAVALDPKLQKTLDEYEAAAKK